MNQNDLGEISTNNDVIINYEEDIDYAKQQIIFDEKIYEEIRKEELDLTPDLVFKNTFWKHTLKIKKQNYYVLTKKKLYYILNT